MVEAHRVAQLLRQHRVEPRRIAHPRQRGLLLNITGCTGCEWTTEAINAAGVDKHIDHVAAVVAYGVCPCGLHVRPGSCGWCEE